jgi:hypothetical protein
VAGSRLAAEARGPSPGLVALMFLRAIGYRRQGVTSALISTALRAAKRAGAAAIEAYPLDADKTPSASGTGYATTFERAGFKAVAFHVPARPIMRHDLKAITRWHRVSVPLSSFATRSESS